MKDLGDLLAWSPEPTPDRYVCRHCGALVASAYARVHAAFHARADPPPDVTASGPDSAAPGPETPAA